MDALENRGGFVRLRNFGALNDPDGYGKSVNDCGETLEIFLKVRNGRVREALFFSDGCLHTLQSGVAVTSLAEGKTLRQCLALTGKAVLSALEDFPPDHGHCVRQALSALKLALRDYAVRCRPEILPEKSSIGRKL